MDYENNNLSAPTKTGCWWLKDTKGNKWRIYAVYPESSQFVLDGIISRGGTFPKGAWTGPIPQPVEGE